MKLTLPLTTAIGLAFFSQTALSAPLFDLRSMSATKPSDQTASPTFTNPRTGWFGLGTSGTPGLYIKDLRAVGTTDLVKTMGSYVVSPPNAKGQQTLTVSCSTDFLHPLTGVVSYTTPLHSFTTPPALMISMAGCMALPMKQAATALGMWVEAAAAATSSSAGSDVRIKIRVLNPATRVGRWSALITSTAAQGNPYYADVVDANGDGTDEIVITYEKVLSYMPIRVQITRVVRNGLTGAVLGQYSWTQ